MKMENSGVLCEIAPVFRPYIQNLYNELKLGLCKAKVDLERIGVISDGDESQFRLVLPYCSKKLKWEVIFDSSTPWFAPDFRFDDDSFLNSPDENFLIKNVPSLSNWNGNDPKALGDVIIELINLFKAHQIKKLNEDECSRAAFEYSALLGNAFISEQDVEVWVGGHISEFLIKLKVDTSRLPELYDEGIDNNPGIDTALLLVRFPNSTNAELMLSPFLTKCLGNISLPLMHQSGVLMDYVPMVTELLNNKIQDLLNNDKLKRELLAQMIVKYEGAVLEHDANSAAFLFEMNDFHWILQIDIAVHNEAMIATIFVVILCITMERFRHNFDHCDVSFTKRHFPFIPWVDIHGVKFPDKPPVLTLRSVYHCSKGKPKFKVLSACPYNHFEAYIEQQVEIFKNECKGVISGNHNLLALDN